MLWLSTLMIYSLHSTAMRLERITVKKKKRRSSEENGGRINLLNLLSFEIPLLGLGPWTRTCPFERLVAHSDIYWRLWRWGICKKRGTWEKARMIVRTVDGGSFSALSWAYMPPCEPTTSTIKSNGSMYAVFKAEPEASKVCITLLSI